MMKTKIVYSIISNENDYYLEKVILSASSLRKYNTGAYIVLITDKETESGIHGRAKVNLDKLFNEIIGVEIPKEFTTPIIRSRIIRTSLPLYVTGDFLFLDADTVICTSLDDIDNIEADLAATEEETIPKNKIATEKAKKVGLDKLFIGKPYYNAGVVYSKDTEISKAFYKEWHTQYMKYALGDYKLLTDQTTFCLSNINQNYPMKKLDHKFNSYLWRDGGTGLEDAHIIHYFSNNKLALCSITDNSLFATIRNEGLDNQLVKCIIDYPCHVIYPTISRMYYWEMERFHILFMKGRQFYRPVHFLSRLMYKLYNFSSKKIYGGHFR